jgi:putative hemolysin
MLTVSTKLLLKVLGVSTQVGEPITEEEIEAMLSEGSAAGVIEDSEHEMVRNVFSLDDRRIGTFMTPRSEMVVLNKNDDLQKNLAKVASSRRSRFPISDGSKDNIVGIVRTKALVQALINQDRPDLTKQAEKPLFVPETLTGRELLEAMRADKATAALVVDEYGDLQGLVTVNDLMNTITGGIDDPMDEPQANQRADGSWLLDGKLSTLELRHILKLKELPDESPGNYDSLGGLMMTLLDRVPTVGEEARWGGWIFEVMDLDGRRIDKVLARKAETKPLSE